MGKLELTPEIRKEYSKYIYDYSQDAKLDSDELMWVKMLRADVKPWSSVEEKRTKEISELIYRLEKLVDEYGVEYYTQGIGECVKSYDLIIPGRRRTEICIYKGHLVYAKNWDENDKRVKCGARVKGTTYYEVVDDGNVIDETYIGYKTLADAEHAAEIYMQYEIQKYVKESKMQNSKLLKNKTFECGLGRKVGLEVFDDVTVEDVINLGKLELTPEIRKEYSKYIYDYSQDAKLDSDELTWVKMLRTEKAQNLKPWSSAEKKRSDEISEVIYNLEHAGDEWCEFYDYGDGEEVKVIEFAPPTCKKTEVCIYKNWLVYAKNWDENDNRVKRGARVKGTTYYDVADDGDVINENYIGYKTLADAEHAAEIYMQYEIQKYVKESVTEGKVSGWKDSLHDDATTLQKKFDKYLKDTGYQVKGYKYYRSFTEYLIEKDNCEIQYRVYNNSTSYKLLIQSFEDYWETCSGSHKKLGEGKVMGSLVKDLIAGKNVRKAIMEEVITRDNGYGNVRSFEIVKKIPKGYEVWNVNFDDVVGGDLVPLCQPKPGTYEIVPDTLKAIHVPNAEDRELLKYGAYWGFKKRNETGKKARALLKSLSESKSVGDNAAEVIQDFLKGYGFNGSDFYVYARTDAELAIDVDGVPESDVINCMNRLRAWGLDVDMYEHYIEITIDPEEERFKVVEN